ncbi:hypothetical protein J1N35_010271 [Gossypium stocksii]|uniref:Uncharacterized protein n=1 Tax=Gossypium stocksii TaxID=47602 RepID=A0A9D3W224_9ROSI|nr:hypothetical protein J1N35_010271 [Gossypium stocksii]
MSGESSEQPRRRGRPIHIPTDNQKKNKRITDRNARQENRVRAFFFQGAMSEAVSKVVSPLRNDLQNVMQTMPNVNLPMASQGLGCQYHQNPVQSDAFAEQVTKRFHHCHLLMHFFKLHLFTSLQQNNQYEDLLNSWDPFILEGSPLGLPFCEEPGTNIMCSTSPCDEDGEKFDDEQVTILLQEWDGNTKGQVQYSDFNGLRLREKTSVKRFIVEKYGFRLTYLMQFKHRKYPPQLRL